MNETIKKNQFEELKEVFEIFDIDKSGKISNKEMDSLLTHLGLDHSNEDLQKLVKQMDNDGDGEVSFKEFIRVFGDIIETEPKYTNAELIDAFNFFDQDNDGTISINELELVCKRLGKRYTKRSISRMIKSVDKDHNGTVSIEEFEALMRNF